MKKIIFFIFYSFLTFSSIAQYTSNPAEGNFSNCTVPNLSCGGLTYLGGSTIRWATTNFPTANEVKFQIRKCNGTFSTAGTMFVKEGSICGAVVGQTNYSSGVYFQNVTIPISHSGSKTYYEMVRFIGTVNLLRN